MKHVRYFRLRKPDMVSFAVRIAAAIVIAALFVWAGQPLGALLLPALIASVGWDYLGYRNWRLAVTSEGMRVRDRLGREGPMLRWSGMRTTGLKFSTDQGAFTLPTLDEYADDIIRYAAEMGVADAKAMLRDPNARYESFFDQSSASMPGRPR